MASCSFRSTFCVTFSPPRSETSQGTAPGDLIDELQPQAAYGDRRSGQSVARDRRGQGSDDVHGAAGFVDILGCPKTCIVVDTAATRGRPDLTA